MSSSCTSLAATVIKPTSKCFASEFASLVESTELPYKPARASMVRSQNDEEEVLLASIFEQS